MKALLCSAPAISTTSMQVGRVRAHMQCLQRRYQQIRDLAHCCNMHHLRATTEVSVGRVTYCAVTVCPVVIVSKHQGRVLDCNLLPVFLASSRGQTEQVMNHHRRCWDTLSANLGTLQHTVGNVSLELCALLTSSLGCTDLLPSCPPRISMALLAITCQIHPTQYSIIQQASWRLHDSHSCPGSKWPCRQPPASNNNPTGVMGNCVAYF